MTNATCSITDCERPAKTRAMCGMHAERVRRHGDPHNSGSFIRGDDEARFWSKVDRDTGACWTWTGTIVNDYGQFSVAGRGVLAHRHAYELLVGPIPKGCELDHVRTRGCKSTLCVNPDHLEPVTQIENLMRSDAWSAVNARKERCIRGHEFDRVILKPDGKRRRKCTTCHRMKTAEAYRRRKANAKL